MGNPILFLFSYMRNICIVFSLLWISFQKSLIHLRHITFRPIRLPIGLYSTFIRDYQPRLEETPMDPTKKI